MLLILADLAELVGTKGPALRCLVFCVLRAAESVAGAYAAQALSSASPFAEYAFPSEDDTSDEAARLARSFRVLAAVFHVLAHCARRAPRLHGGAARRRLARLVCLGPAFAAAQRPRFIDTS